MLNSRRLSDRRSCSVKPAVTVAVAVALVLPTGTLRAQLPPLKPAHLNPTIEKLAAGKPVFGAIISDLSMTSARTWARSGGGRADAPRSTFARHADRVFRGRPN